MFGRARLDGTMTTLIQHIVSLGETLADHQGKTHWTVSKLVSSKSDFIHRLKIGGDMNTRTYQATLQRFSDIWPDQDLCWPSDVPRPRKKKDAA
jgi:hypothetical protein